MNKKTRLTMTALLTSFAAVFSAGAQEVTAPATPPPVDVPAVSVTVTPTFVSQYMFRGQRLSGAAFQPAVEMAYGNLGVGVWSSFPLDNTVPGVSDPEIDPYAYYTFAASDTVKVIPGFTLYTFPDADESAGFYKVTFEPNLAVSFALGPITLTPKIYYDFTLEGPTYELTAGFSVPLEAIGSELAFTGQYGTYKLKEFAKDSVPSTKAWGDYWLVGVALPYKLSETSKVSVGFAYTKGTEAFVKQGTFPKSENTGAIGRGVVTVSYSITF